MMTNLGAALLHNGIYFGVAFVLMLVLTLVATSAVQRLSDLFLRAKILAISAESKEAFRRRIRRLSLLFFALATLLLTGATLLATWRQIRIGDYLRTSLERMQIKDWLGLGLAVAKTVGVILAAFIVARIIVTVLHYLRERLQRAETLAGHRDRMTDLLARLRLALSYTIFFGTLILCGQLIGLSDRALRWVWIPAIIGVAFYVGRFAVGTSHLAIDVLFDLSDMLTRLESPLRYLGRFRHLSKLTKRSVDYFIYVGIATWTIDQITPGTWASQAGRLGIRIIAIFYISRVLVEVCVLFMNEFFLSRAEQSEAEYQQRQTLVPVAAGLLRYGIYFAAVVMILREAGIDPTPLLAGAGVAGVAIGLGAQAFVGDIVAGFFILFENLFLVGDFIEVGGVKGKVEEIGVRVTRLRDEAGVLHAIPNGEVRKVSSHSKGYVNVVIDLPIPYGENLHQVFEALSKKAAELRDSQTAIMGLTEFSLEEMKESLLLLRTVTMVKPSTNQELSAILRLGFWEALTAAGVAAPFARRLMIAAAPNSTGNNTPAAALAAHQGSDEAQQSDIQRLKAYHLYRGFDVDGNGFIEKSDADALARRILEGQGRALGSPLHLELTRTLGAYWNALVSSVDRNQDGRVSKDEFLQFSANMADSISGPAGDSVKAVADVLFAIADRDGTGTISEKEFIAWTRVYRILDSVAAAGFRLIDADGNARITRDEWQRFISDLFRSQKMNDAAALVFGPGCRESD